MKPAIPYYRVSTARQGQSGLGLEAQKKAVRDFAKVNSLRLVKEFTEVESGSRNKRPVLQQAIAACKADEALLLIAKLDRLGRNVLFISTLMESRVEFVAVDNPSANKFIVHIMAAFAEHERDLISARTKAALKAAKSRGVELGANGKYILSERNREASKAFAEKMKPIVERLQKEGFTTVREITAELNRRNVPTYHEQGRRWHLATVHKILKSV
ncbi:MAG: recombinase family protein [Williamsia sp.]|nr:recombinase family protein [Williamsia sp.]